MVTQEPTEQAAEIAEIIGRLPDGQFDQCELNAILGRLSALVDTNIDAMHIPADAGEYEQDIVELLARIPQGWGRWISCEAGWYPLIAALGADLAIVDPDYEIHQIKEKFGMLRFYAETSLEGELGERFDALIEAAERAARLMYASGVGANQQSSASPAHWLGGTRPFVLTAATQCERTVPWTTDHLHIRKGIEMTREGESLTKATGKTAMKAPHNEFRKETTFGPEEPAGGTEPATTNESESTPTEVTQGAQSESDTSKADRLDEVLDAAVTLILRRYVRKVENGDRWTAESDLAELLGRARELFTCAPAPADSTPGPWTPLIANKDQDDEYSYWGRPVYWMNRQVLDQLSVVVMGTQAWGEDSGDVYPEVLVTDSAHRPYTEDWWRLEAVTPAKAREIAAALAEAADKADEVEAALCPQKD